jgi:hypothetical protein
MRLLWLVSEDDPRFSEHRGVLEALEGWSVEAVHAAWAALDARGELFL